jgi:hypothetical protein
VPVALATLLRTGWSRYPSWATLFPKRPPQTQHAIWPSFRIKQFAAELPQKTDIHQPYGTMGPNPFNATDNYRRLSDFLPLPVGRAFD